MSNLKKLKAITHILAYVVSIASKRVLEDPNTRRILFFLAHHMPTCQIRGEGGR
jgi:hypothetical protein